MDPHYQRLEQQYQKAARAYRNAIQDRRRVRDRLAVAESPVLQALDAWSRRPVGSPEGTRLSGAVSEPPGAPPPRTRRIYMGEILGWATLVGAPTAEVAHEPQDVDVDKLYDRISLQLYWNAKQHYERAARAFLEHARRQRVEQHRQAARDELDHSANLQILGIDVEGVDFLEAARAHVEQACKEVWKIYADSPNPKSHAAKAMLLEQMAEAQYVDLQSPTTGLMDNEYQRLLAEGAIRRGN